MSVSTSLYARSFVACVVVATLAGIAAPAASAQVVFNPANGHFYALTPVGTLASARAAAAAMNGHLVDVGDANESNFLHFAFLPPGASPKWIGLSDDAVEGTFRWSDGATPTFTLWDLGQPSGGATDADGVVMKRTGLFGVTVGWDDVAVAETHAGIVEMLVAPGDEPGVAIPVTGDASVLYNTTNLSVAGPAPTCASDTSPQPQDMWYRYTAATDGILTVSNCPGSIEAPGGSAIQTTDTVISILSADGGTLACADDSPQCSYYQSEASACVVAGQVYYVQVAAWDPTTPPPTGVLAFKLKVLPGSDDCPCAPSLNLGVNGPFDNSVATDAVVAYTGCEWTARDLWFKYVATEASRVTISTIGWNQQTSGSLSDPNLSVYDGCGGPLLACTDDYPTIPLTVTVVARAGQDLRIRVAGWMGAVGTFTLTVTKDSNVLVMSSPSGPGSILIENQGTLPSAPYVSIFTFNGAGYPNGPFFGISPSITEVVIQMTTPAAPFVGLLDANGRSAFGPVVGLPPLTLYGVTLFLHASGVVSAVSPPYKVTI